MRIINDRETRVINNDNVIDNKLDIKPQALLRLQSNDKDKRNHDGNIL